MNLRGRWAEDAHGNLYEIISNPISNDGRELIACIQILFERFSKLRYGDIIFMSRSLLRIEDDDTYNYNIQRSIMAEKEISNGSEREWYKDPETYCNKYARRKEQEFYELNNASRF